MKRFGINLSGQTYYDSGQMLRNLTFRNPGFEGETWRSILHCKTVTATSCTDDNQYTVWPAGFLANASYEFLSGPARGTTGIIQSSSAASQNQGITLTLRNPAKAPATGDFILVSLDKPGNAQAGWWTNLNGGASLSTEFHDLAPHSPGKQALRIDASGAGQTAAISSYFDSFAGRSFVQMHGRFTISFRAKGLGATHSVAVKLERLDTTHGVHTFFSRTVPLASTWQDYSFDFNAAEDGSASGTVGLTFTFHESSALLDDVALTAAPSPSNPTAFRDEVVQTLRELHPGVLRYMDNGTSFGSSLDNLLAPPLARNRAGSSTRESVKEDIPIGLHEFLTLAKAVGAEPWFSMPPGLSAAEGASLIEYLSGTPSTRFGGIRASLGQREPWTSVFPTIHLELGNEQWNATSFAGATMADPLVYAWRAGQIYGAMRGAPGFSAGRFDLILGSWAAVPWWTAQELKAGSGFDSIAVAPYVFNDFNDAATTEAVFGPMLAEPEQTDSRPGGTMAQQAQAVHSEGHATQLSVYEVNLGAMTGGVSQAEIDSAIPSLGAGLAVIDHMLLMLRDLGITTQCLFALPEYANDFGTTPKRTMPLWGAVVDMGGQTNLRRPQFLAEEMANSTMLSTMLTTHLTTPSTSAHHTWDQHLSANDKVKLDGANLIQTFAFAEGSRRSLILLNLSRTETIPLAFAGGGAPRGVVEESLLTSAKITDSNEQRSAVAIEKRRIAAFDPAVAYKLPPFSMTTLTWVAR